MAESSASNSVSSAACKAFIQKLQAHEGKYADFTIKRGQRSWKVHKLVICMQSEYFEKACSGGFKEAKNNTITLSSEDDEAAISSMINYLYHFDYSVDNSQTAPPPLLQHIRIFTVADKYLIPSLREMASEKIRARLATDWNTDTFAMAIREVYALDPVHKDMLMPGILGTVASHRELLVAGEGKYTAFRNTLRDLDGFAADALIAVAEAGPVKAPFKKYRCPGCKNTFSISIQPDELRCPFGKHCNASNGTIASTTRPVSWWSSYLVYA